MSELLAAIAKAELDLLVALAKSELMSWPLLVLSQLNRGNCGSSQPRSKLISSAPSM